MLWDVDQGDRRADPNQVAADLLQRVAGQRPQVTGACPGRINLLGEHTDYNGGLCLPFAVSAHTAAAVSQRADRWVRVWSDGFGGPVSRRLDQLQPGMALGPGEEWAAYPLGVVWALDRSEPRAAGLDIAVASSLDSGAGLASSAALTCAVGLAVSRLGGASTSRRRLAAFAREAENRMAGVPSGWLDQYAVLFARRRRAMFLDCARLRWQYVDCDFRPHGLAVLVVAGRQMHSHRVGGYGALRERFARAAADLGLASLGQVAPEGMAAARRRLPGAARPLLDHLRSENQRVREAVELLRLRRPGQLGQLLNSSHASLRDRLGASTAELDELCELARDAGALGARMVGGGGGGAALALVPSSRLHRVQQALARDAAVAVEVTAERGAWTLKAPPAH